MKVMNSKTIFVDTEINLIQQLRLMHALSESEFNVKVIPQDAYKLELLSEKFGMQYDVGTGGDLNISEITEIHHKKPGTSVGSIDRTLIFAHVVTDYCKSLWAKTRKHRYTFAGLVTKNRKGVIIDWVEKNTSGNPSRLTNSDSFLYKVRKKVYHALGIDDSIYKELGDLVVWSSTRGRKYPEKSWDDNYYRFLADSQFVLCPSGNSVWSYRFFESILCGAIPIIEEMCPAYEGFKFYTMQDDASKLEWSAEVAEYNYKLCLERNTISEKDLNAELDLLLNEKVAV